MLQIPSILRSPEGQRGSGAAFIGSLSASDKAEFSQRLAAERGIPEEAVLSALRNYLQLRDFKFPEPAFTERLQKEQGWDATFTGIAKDEYLKFIALAASSIKEVTPSKIVDEVWHTHLVFSKSYYEDLCQAKLGKVIHHNPGTGEAADEQRFARQYNQTLEFYEVVFLAEAPQIIWGRKKKFEDKQTASREKSDAAATQGTDSRSDNMFLYAACSTGSAVALPNSEPASSKGDKAAESEGDAGESAGDVKGAESAASAIESAGVESSGFSLSSWLSGFFSSSDSSAGSSCASSSCGSSSCGGGGCGGGCGS